MRVSIKMNDLTDVPVEALFAGDYVPYLDGVRLEACIMADEELGVAECYTLGRYPPATETLRGKVQVRRALDSALWTGR
jgi:hypothetical protein